MPIMYLLVMLLAQTIFNSIDSTMLGLIYGDYEVGIYSTAHKISDMITQLVTSLIWVIMPRMSYYFEEGDYININTLLRKVLGFNALIGLPLAVGTYMLADEIILTIAGEGYNEAGSVLKVLMLGFVFTLFGGSFLGNSILLPSKREKSFMFVCCIAALVNIMTNYIFIPRYAALAAAGTTSFCALVIFVALLFTIDKRIKIVGVTKLIIVPILGCVGIIIVCLCCKQICSLWGRIIHSIAVSSIVYFLINFFGGNELLKEFIESIKRRLLRKK